MYKSTNQRLVQISKYRTNILKNNPTEEFRFFKTFLSFVYLFFSVIKQPIIHILIIMNYQRLCCFTFKVAFETKITLESVPNI